MLQKRYFKRKLNADSGVSGGGLLDIVAESMGASQGDKPIQEQQKTDTANDTKQKIEFTSEQQEKVDKLLNTAYAKAAAKFEKDYNDKISAIQEAEKLKNMSDAERQKAEYEKAQAKIADYERKELINQFKLELAEKNVPTEFAEYLNIQDAETAQKAVHFLSGYTDKITQPLTEKISQLEIELKNANLRGPAPKDFKTAGMNGFSSLAEAVAENISKIPK